MTTSSKRENEAQKPAQNTGDYSATKAPENQEHVESTRASNDPKTRPGGAHGVPVEVGMAGLDRDTVPGLAPTGQADEDVVDSREERERSHPE
jgi:hypothetical protein